jgi:Rps23 Pro-64 3,4-dihydroxylase Tpa1-like proline 4-hydroxylase
MQTLDTFLFKDPFPHMIVENFYNDDELKLIWEELDFYTKDGKLFDAHEFGGVVNKTNSKAIWLDKVFDKKYRNLSNILKVNRKLFDSAVLEAFSSVHDCCSIAKFCNYDVTKVRYYHDGDYYEPHTDKTVQFLGFSYFYREPKKFEGGELIFPKYDYTFDCPNNSLIMMPGWVEHGVSKISIKNSDYFDGYGRYAVTSFFSNKDKKETE